MLKMKFIKKDLVNWFNIYRDNVIFFLKNFPSQFNFFTIKLILLLLLKFYIIHALILHLVSLKFC